MVGNVGMSGAVFRCAYAFARPEDGVWCGVFVWEVSDEWMLAPDRSSSLLGRVSVGWVALLVGSRIDCGHSHTQGLERSRTLA